MAATVVAARDTLTHLYVTGNNLGSAGTAALFEAIVQAEGLPALVELRVDDCAIRPEAAHHVASALAHLPSLEILNISTNPLAPMGMAALAAKLKFTSEGSPPKLKELKLGWIKLGSVGGAESAADVLQFNTTVETIDLRGNDLKNNGVLHIARAMRAREGAPMQEMLLEYNSIEDQGLCALAQALKANPDAAPRLLKVSYNNHSSMARVALDEARDMVLELAGEDIELWY